MELTAEQILDNWEKFINIIKTEFSGDRQKDLLQLYGDIKERVMYAPASSRVYYHGCFPGGYLVHVLNVINFIQELDSMWENKLNLLDIEKTYTREEMIFVALNHDLGKLGDDVGEHYITHNEHWKKERGELYSINEDIDNMDMIDRTFYMLQLYGIVVTRTEFLGIKLHEMMFDKANDFYLMTYSKGKQLKTELPILMHSADHIATRYEYIQWLTNNTPTTSVKKPLNNKNKKLNLPASAAAVADKFFNKEKE